MSAPTPQYTDFSKDVLGRYVCNGLDEAEASTRAPAGRPFDIVIVGGGSFGAVVAQHLLYNDRYRNHRILVLEAGPFLLPEHVQNLPTLGLFPPHATTTDPGVPRNEVWGLPWRSEVEGGWPGLAYCLGGRSIYWGGWSPELLDEEMPPELWPESVVRDLQGPLPDGRPGYFQQAAEQIGTDRTNDFVHGTLHDALRRRVATAIRSRHVQDDAGAWEAIPLEELPPSPARRPRKVDADEWKLEAPLAVQGRAERSGFFPLNKFSSIPLIVRAARQAWTESGGDDSRKRLMVVPNCHVLRLDTRVEDGVGRVTRVHTSLGEIDLPDRGVVILASGTIESTRLALESFEGVRGYDLMGTNLLAHLRSNVAIRIPREALGVPLSADLQASALFVKCRKRHDDGTVSHFHLQITAAGAKGIGSNSDAELFQKIPDIDTVHQFRAADEDHVALTIRAIGEVLPGNPENFIALGEERDQFRSLDPRGMRRAHVRLGNSRRRDPQPWDSPQTRKDRECWEAMDQAAERLRKALGGTLVSAVRDGMGTTHHEAGTLWMGRDPEASVTTPNGRFHSVVNAYAVGPAVLPTVGSPNPMLSGVALARRLAEHLVAPKPAPSLEGSFEWLFDGTSESFARWEQVGPGAFDLREGEGVMVAHPGDGIGLLLFPDDRFDEFVLRLQFRVESPDDNSGVFVRCRDPRLPAPDVADPRAVTNPAWIAVHTGLEVQVDEVARPDGLDMHRTGSVYGVEVGEGEGRQRFRRGSALQPGEWNDLEIEVRETTGGTSYAVRLNGHETTALLHLGGDGRGLSPAADPRSGFLGLQQHTGPVSFRAVRVRKLA